MEVLVFQNQFQLFYTVSSRIILLDIELKMVLLNYQQIFSSVVKYFIGNLMRIVDRNFITNGKANMNMNLTLSAKTVKN